MRQQCGFIRFVDCRTLPPANIHKFRRGFYLSDRLAEVSAVFASSSYSVYPVMDQHIHSPQCRPNKRLKLTANSVNAIRWNHWLSS
jgi:hypothetical protein